MISVTTVVNTLTIVNVTTVTSATNMKKIVLVIIVLSAMNQQIDVYVIKNTESVGVVTPPTILLLGGTKNDRRTSETNCS